jgi:AGZA family xanthine/uracil permease-like MFS transporter
MATSPAAGRRYEWARPGDINAFFGLALDNVAVLILLVSLLTAGGGFSPEFVLTRMVPGTALGVLVGDLAYTWMAFRLARRTGRPDVTAMPLGLDTPSTFGVALLVLRPVFAAQVDHGASAEAAMIHAWHVGALVLVLVGVFKVFCAPLGNAVRRWVPRAGLLGSLAAIALALIAFLPLLLHVAAVPPVGLLALTVILVTLVAHRPLPGRIPGALAAALVGTAVYYMGRAVGDASGVALVAGHPGLPAFAWSPPDLLPALDWAGALPEALEKLPVILPFALATVVGGIDCTESAAAAGDGYDTRTVLLTEGLASVAAGLCGGVIQNTPYIGHPAYKAMGGRAAYTLATALFIAAAGWFGWFAHLFEWLPEAALFPVLVFVGLEIMAQSFRATPARHYPALALAALPVLAYAATAVLGQLRSAEPRPDSALAVQTLRSLANGFVITSLLWGAALAALIDGRYRRAAVYCLVAGGLALFGVIHSPLADGVIGLPGSVTGQLEKLPSGNDLEAAVRQAALLHTPYHWAGAYALVAALLLVLSLFGQQNAAAVDRRDTTLAPAEPGGGRAEGEG